MIYNPSELPTPDRPPAVHREIVGVLLAMACVSAMLVLYLQESWCPMLPSLCLDTGKPSEEAAEGGEADAPGGAEFIRTGQEGTGFTAGSLVTPPAFPTPFAGLPTPMAPVFATVDPRTSGGFPGGIPTMPAFGQPTAVVPAPGALEATMEARRATQAAAMVGSSGIIGPGAATGAPAPSARAVTASAPYPGTDEATETPEPTETLESAYP